MIDLRAGAEVEALVTDRYLDALLAAGERRALDAPADADLDPTVRRAAGVLWAELVRVHPSFRFEERLAGRLSGLAAEIRRSGWAAIDGDRAGAASPSSLRTAAFAPIEAAFGPDPEADRLERARPLLIGGAMASAALSIAGAAVFAWRRSRVSVATGGESSRGAAAAAGGGGLAALPGLVAEIALGALAGRRAAPAQPPGRGATGEVG